MTMARYEEGQEERTMLAIVFYGVGLVGLLTTLVRSVHELYHGDDVYSGRTYMELYTVTWLGFLAGTALTGDIWGFTSLLGLAVITMWLAYKVYIPKGLHF